MGATKKVTVSTLSEMTGVSRATISRVLNNNTGVNPDVKRKVLEAVERTGYHKSPRNLAPLSTQLHGTVTVLGDDVTLLNNNAFYDPIFKALYQRAQELNLKLDFHISKAFKEHNPDLHFLDEVQTAIIVGTDSPSLIDAVVQRDINAVLLNAIDAQMRISSVLPDYEFGAYLMTDYLIRQHHQHIKFLTANIKHSTYQRTDGFLRALRMHKLPCAYEHNVIDVTELADRLDPSGSLKRDIFAGVVGPDFGISRFFDYLIDHDYFKDVTAVFCICDAAAIGLINRFTERGLKVPDDISVTGFDDITIASLVSPSLTTIASNKVRLANGALELLQWQLQSAASSDEEQGSARKIIKAYQNVELVERQSVKNLAM